jgi:SRSO17 transposase
LDQNTLRPVAVKYLAEGLERTTVRWRKGTRGWLEAEFAWVRIWVGHRWERGVPIEVFPDPEASARWLLVEWRRDGTVRYALANLPPDTTLREAVPRWKARWQVERGYLQLKDELGLDHFEGRGWTGFHHATPTFLADGFLALDRQRAQTLDATDPPGEARRGV